jgi:ABC-2 type transport system ATP-binding protein
MDHVIEAHGISKRYGKVQALTSLDLVALPGRVTALLGPNGAGKTTFMRTVATLSRPDSGTLRVAGIDAFRHAAQVRQVIGLAGQYAAVEEALTGRENLELIGHLFGLRRRAARAAANNVLERLGLTKAGDRLVRTYSGGMRRKLDLGASLVGSPRLLLLDEPTTGLDPGSRIDLWDFIRNLVETGTSVLLTTQYLDEADQLATDIAVIDHGKVIASGTPAELKSDVGRDVIEIHLRHAEDVTALAAALERQGRSPRIDAPVRRLSITADEGVASLTQTIRVIDSLGFNVENIALRQPTLDEVFLALTGNAPSTSESVIVQGSSGKE